MVVSFFPPLYLDPRFRPLLLKYLRECKLECILGCTLEYVYIYTRQYTPTHSIVTWALQGDRLREATMVNLLFQLLVQKLPGHQWTFDSFGWWNFCQIVKCWDAAIPRLLDCMRLPEIPEDEEALELLQHARLFAAEVSHWKIPVDERLERCTYCLYTFL